MGIGISLSNLASAVANMGGIGIISTVGIGFLHPEKGLSYRKSHIKAIREEIRLAREKTKGILGVNIMTVLTNYAETVQTALEEGIDIIFSGAGLPLDLPKYLNEKYTSKLVPIVSSSRAANIICNKWWRDYNYLPDAFVVEGPKAGGHLGFKREAIQNVGNKLENIVSEVLKVTSDCFAKYKKDIPVIAAGGIFNGKDIFNIINRGASGVQMGTRFVATDECDASPKFIDAFLNSTSKDVHLITSPVGLPGRTIYNNFIKEVEEGNRKPNNCKYHCIKTCNPKTTPFCIAEALIQAYKGNMNDGFAFSGSNVYKVNKMSSVKELFQELSDEFTQAKNESHKSDFSV